MNDLVPIGIEIGQEKSESWLQTPRGDVARSDGPLFFEAKFLKLSNGSLITYKGQFVPNGVEVVIGQADECDVILGKAMARLLDQDHSNRMRKAIDFKPGDLDIQTTTVGKEIEVRITHNPTGVSVTEVGPPSQLALKDAAMRRLTEEVYEKFYKNGHKEEQHGDQTEVRQDQAARPG